MKIPRNGVAKDIRHFSGSLLVFGMIMGIMYYLTQYEIPNTNRDLLTTLVKALLNSETPPSWANDFINKIESNNVLKARGSTEEIIKDMADYKASMRTRQGQYFEERSGQKEPTYKNETTSK